MPESINLSEASGTTLTGNERIRLKRMGQGLGLLIIAVMLAIVCGMLQAILMMAFKLDFTRGWSLAIFRALTWIVPLVLVIGVCLCLAVPGRARAARFAIATIAMAVASFFAMGTAAPAPRPWGPELLISACQLATAVCFLWYLRRVAAFMGERRIARQAMYLLIGMLFVYIAGFATPLVEKLVIHMTAEGWKALLSLTTVVAVLGYLNLIENLRSAVRRSTANA